MGSDADNSIQLPLPGVEGFHGELEVTEDGRLIARDAGSMSGMTIQDEPVTESVLSSSHPLSIGEAQIFYQPPPSAAPSKYNSILPVQEADADEPATWWAALPGTLLYPFVSVLFVLFIVVGIYFNLPFGLGLIGFIGSLALLGSLVFTMMNTVASAAGGESPYSLSNFVEFSLADSFESLVQYIALIVVCMGPAIFVNMGYDGEETSKAWLLILTMILGSVYLPIPFLALSLTGSLSVLNPVFVIKSFLRIPGPVILMAVLLILINVGNEILIATFAKPEGFGSQFIPGSFLSVIYFCLLNAWCRALGLMYYYYEKRLNWI